MLCALSNHHRQEVCLMNIQHPQPAPTQAQTIDALFARLEYLMKVRQARLTARDQIAASGRDLTVQQLDILLKGGTP